MNERFWISFGDIHEDVETISRIPGIEKAQGVIVSGDITTRGQRSVAERILGRIEQRNPSVFAQIGNMDSREVEALLNERGWNIHARGVDLGDGVGLVGMGYSTPTPFNTPSEVSDEQLGEWLRSVEETAAGFDTLLFVVHTPPYGTRTDRLSDGTHVGSRSVREFLEQIQPAVCITGHIHESRATDTIGRTTIINPGTLSAGGYVRIVQTPDGLKAELEEV